MSDPPAHHPREFRTADSCPHCQYALAGLPKAAGRCPECGGELSARAYALAAARRMTHNLRARMALIASPVAGLFAAYGVFVMHRGWHAALGALLLALWAGAATALYVTTGVPGARRPWRAVLLGLPLGIAYFAAVFGTAFAVVLVVVRISGR